MNSDEKKLSKNNYLTTRSTNSIINPIKNPQKIKI